MGTLAKVALFECERLLCFGFVCFLASFLFAFPLVIAFQIAFYKILVAYLRDFGRHAYIAREKLALAASCLACGYTCFLLNACHRSVLLLPPCPCQTYFLVIHSWVGYTMLAVPTP